MENAFKQVSVFSVHSGAEIEKPDFWDVVKVVGDFCCRFSDSEV